MKLQKTTIQCEWILSTIECQLQLPCRSTARTMQLQLRPCSYW